jgi:hypothetical protein
MGNLVYLISTKGTRLMTGRHSTEDACAPTFAFVGARFALHFTLHFIVLIMITFKDDAHWIF